MAQRIYNIKQLLLTENTYDGENSRYLCAGEMFSHSAPSYMVKLAEHFQILGASIRLRHIFVTLVLLECSSVLVGWE